ncbi:amidohydrolase family protein [Paenibacillus spongiae]|uniref:Amidohydrolase family protein n=1 Tax=Paenibacillus spongiae TaxID=2909671 RepID=A0ABY5S3P7_9BACL|nr:amidohydrolase family protein [Paenibacillus spongiae]UVI28517.1 amidohydrolase family protein [Paenibacillus spongiae]
MRIDAHQHYWKLGRGDYNWLSPNSGVLYRDYLPEELLPHVREHQLDGTILVQAAATLEETEYMLSLSDTNDSILGVVGWLDLHDPAYRDHFEKFSRHPKFAGFRVMIQDMPDAHEVLEPDVVEALTYFAGKDVPVDLLLVSHQLDVVVELLERVPGLRGVIDHIAKPRIADGILEPWMSQMSAIAKHPNIYCKLSGMVTEADHTSWKPQDFSAYIRPILDMFGPERVMFGSDWPVCLLAASYDQVVDILEQALPDSLSAEDRAKLFGLNAKKFYKL